ncbi:MAG TPA: hypothetical protein VFZ56_01175 [Gemmatimonadaceae bacterium]
MAAMHAARPENARPLGALPLVVLAREQFSAPPDVDPAEWQREKMARSVDLARLSSAGRLEIDASSGHHIHMDNPRLVVEAIRSVVRRATGAGM